MLLAVSNGYLIQICDQSERHNVSNYTLLLVFAENILSYWFGNPLINLLYINASDQRKTHVNGLVLD